MILDMLAVLFIGLKLGAVIDWHWLLVLSPLWIQFGIGLLFARYDKGEIN